MDLSKAPDMKELHTLSLSFISSYSDTFHLDELPSLPLVPNLSSLHLTLSGDRRSISTSSLLKLFSELNPACLHRLSLLNLLIDAKQLSIILKSCPNLEELYISAASRHAALNCPDLKGSGLKVFHLNAPSEFGPSGDDLLELARSMLGLDQIGSGNRVYEVWRSLGDNDEKVVELSRWGRITVPAYFQIWRG